MFTSLTSICFSLSLILPYVISLQTMMRPSLLRRMRLTVPKEPLPICSSRVTSKILSQKILQPSDAGQHLPLQLVRVHLLGWLYRTN
jgi:hypothetical protein